MTDGRFPEPAPEPEHPNQAADGRDLRPERNAPWPIIRFPYARLCSQPPTANRQHLPWVGRVLRTRRCPEALMDLVRRTDGSESRPYQRRPYLGFRFSFARLCSQPPTANRQPPPPTMGRAGSPNPPLNLKTDESRSANGRLGEPSLPTRPYLAAPMLASVSASAWDVL